MVRPRAPLHLRALLNEAPRRSAALLCLGAASAAVVTAVGVPAAGLAAQDDGEAKASAPARPPAAVESEFGWAAPAADRPADDFGDEQADFGARPLAEPAAAPAADVPAADVPAADVPADVSVPGAASVEPVLRAVYRPHPTRVEAVYRFLTRQAVSGVSVSLRLRDEDGNTSTAVPYTVIRPDGTRNDRLATLVKDGKIIEDAELELVVIAPAEQQRAIGTFLSLCVSKQPAAAPPEFAPQGSMYPADSAFDAPPGYRDPEPDDFSTSRVAPGVPSYPFGDDFGAAPDAFDGSPFGDPVAADDFGDDSFDDRGFGDDFGGEPAFGDDPARTTRRVPRNP